MKEIEVNTSAGRLVGVPVEGVNRWLGVPYAKAARFAAPGPADAWTGSRHAFAMAPQCPQLFSTSAKRAKVNPPDYSEDCLALNIWAPANGNARQRPVFVWLHGGAFVTGGSNNYDGSELAKLGDMVVVVINYRLGILGCVNFGDALGLPEIPSNLALRDQIAALEWIRDNIAVFGGDPGRVTICGESAGAMFVAMLMLCSKAHSLFHGAIMQSGALNMVQSREKSRRIAARYADLLGTKDLDQLRSLDLRQLFAAQAKLASEQRDRLPAAPWFDGDLLPGTCEEACAAATAPVPLIAGWTRDEIRLLEILPVGITPTKRADLEALIRHQRLPHDAENLLALYPSTTAGRRALATDLCFSMPVLHFAARHARTHPTWIYRFDYAHPLLGAMHAIDTAFLWPIRGIAAALMRGGPMIGRRRALGSRMQSHWTHFVSHGRPNADWPIYTAEQQQALSFDLEDRVITGPATERAVAWNGRDIQVDFLVAE